MTKLTEVHPTKRYVGACKRTLWLVKRTVFWPAPLLQVHVAIRPDGIFIGEPSLMAAGVLAGEQPQRRGGGMCGKNTPRWKLHHVFAARFNEGYLMGDIIAVFDTNGLCRCR